MPNAGRREKGPKCGSLPLNAGELAALRVQDAATAVRGFKPTHRAMCLCVRASVHLNVCHGRCVFVAEVASFSTNRS